MLEAVHARGAVMLRAYPSAIYELCRMVDGPVARSGLRAVVTGSEPLFGVQRELVERTLGCPVFDSYGMAERVAFACQCEHGRYHLNPEYSYVEILDDAGQPTDDFGNIVGTTLRNHVMPLLRYRISDRAKWVKEACPCGRHYPVIELSSGKVEDQLYDADGTPVSASIITFAFKGLANIRKAQVAQTERGIWEVRVVPDGEFVDADGQALLANIASHVTERIGIRLRVVDDIPPLASGKFKWVSQEWRSH
ncbi:hypothetical protein SNE35_05040 [Paucibacter sp. R3-3]|uniref:Uncharacterized protein n=1 Tax=Roseateles agri TaxID=3098619 RepID=A0ABU5DC47_9BURK|nr:hypothetical protein [Paucibacter sp. R3-3]MDY0743856.1 hypothetical protein [Paucibacter sp. R3-3]